MSNLKSLSSGVHVPTHVPIDYVVEQPYVPPAGVVMQDDFEGVAVGALPVSTGGLWYGFKEVSVTDVISHTGSQCCKFAYRPTQSSELSFRLDNMLIPEVWIQWWTYLPDGTEGIGVKYEHTVDGRNNKLLRIRCREEDNTGTTLYQGASLFPYVTTPGLGSVGMEQSNYEYDQCGVNLFPIGAEWGGKYELSLGVWHKLTFRFVLNGPSNDDGIVEFYLNNVLKANHDSMAMGLNANCNTGWKSGYINGSANAAYAADTNIYVDDFIVSTDDPR